MDSGRLKGLYGRLKGLKELTAVHSTLTPAVAQDYNDTVQAIEVILGENLNTFRANPSINGRGSSPWFSASELQEKLFQFISHLEYQYNLGEAVVELGSIYNSIDDEELKSRCSDILSSPGPFDRVINQATLVLEDRIRTRAKLDKSLVGVNLVNKALNSDLSKSILKISDNVEEHEGVCHISRGIMLAFRHPTHHFLTDQYSREDAIKICAFVDNLLKIIAKAKLRP